MLKRVSKLFLLWILFCGLLIISAELDRLGFLSTSKFLVFSNVGFS